MPRIKKLFANSVQDKDSNRAFILPNNTRHTENLRFDTNDGDDGIGKNIKGTTLISDATDANNDFKCVGAYFNEDKNVIYYFIATTSGQLSKVVEYNLTTGQTVVMLHDTTGVLNLDKNGIITGINEIDGLLYWSEWGNNPRRINTERAKTYGVDGYTEDDIKVKVVAPFQKISTLLRNSTTSSQEQNHIEDIMIAFSYRWRYLDGEYSALAPFTLFKFYPKSFVYDFAEQSNRSMINAYNEVLLTFDTGNERVAEIQLVWTESESNVAWVIDDFNKSILGYGDNQAQTHVFLNNKTERALPQEVMRSYFNNVPLTALAQTMIDGRLFYGNYLENHDLLDRLGNPIEIDYDLSLIAADNTSVINGETIPSLFPLESVKSNIDYSVLLAYLDGDGRMTTGLQSKNNTLFVPIENSITANRIRITLRHNPPNWARYFRFFVKQNKKDYEQIITTTFYEDGVYRWVKLEGADKDKVNEGDYLIVKSDLSGPKNTLIKAKVLEIKDQEEDFADSLTGTGSVGTASAAGLYMKIKHTDFDMTYNTDNLIERSDYNETQGPPNVDIIVSQTPIVVGARISIFIESWEKNKNDNYYSYDETFIAQAAHASFQAWFAAEVIDLGDFETNHATHSFESANTIFRIQSLDGGYGIGGTRKLYGEVKIQNAGVIIFETEPKRQPEEIYHEVGRTYSIVVSANQAFYHSHLTQYSVAGLTPFPGDVSQDVANDFEVTLDWFNCFSYGNAVESYKIRDEFNEKSLDVGVRTLTNTKDRYKQIHRKEGITWSDIYSSETGFNGLGTFNLSLINFIDLDKEKGSVQKIHNIGGNLLVLQEDASGTIPYNKNIIQDVQGGKVVGIATNILDKRSYNPFGNGKFGISKHPETFVQDGFRFYYTDEQRGALIRLSRDGITEIDETFMDHFFSEKMLANKELKTVAGFDPLKKEYLLHLPSEGAVLAHKKKSKGFPNFFTYEPDFILGANNQCYAWKNGVMYKLNSNVTANNFFGTQSESKIKFYFNKEFSVEKIWKALGIESSHPWDIDMATELTSRNIPKESFEKKEDYWYSEIMGNTNGVTEASNVFGLGTFAITNGEIITTRRPENMCVGDSVISKTLPFSANKIVDLANDRIILENNITEASSFLMYSKNQNIDGAEIRGDVLEVEMTNDSTEEVTLRAVNAEVVKSFYS